MTAFGGGYLVDSLASLFGKVVRTGQDDFEPKRCRKTISDEDLPDDKGGWCCNRPIWEDHDYCFWHADRAGKKNTDSGAKTRDREALLTAKDDTICLDKANLSNAEFCHTSESGVFNIGFTFQGHSLVGANLNHAVFDNCWFKSADLRAIEAEQANFDKISFDKADLSGADLRWATGKESRFWHTTANEITAPGFDFTDANLFQAEFQNANLANAIFKEANAHGTSFIGANIEDANLERCELQGADLTDARLYGAEVRFTGIDETTELGDRCIYEKEADREVLPEEERGNVLLTKAKTAWRYFNHSPEASDEPGKLRKASRVYRMYQRLLRENDLPDEIRHYRIREREVRRKMALQENNLTKWFAQSVQRWSMNYGESVTPVIGLSVVVIAVCMLLFPLWGVDAGNTVIEYGSSRGLLWTLGKSFYFSAVTFTTLGYGDLQPVGWSQLLATVETFTGSLLMALLVFVLGQRASW